MNCVFFGGTITIEPMAIHRSNLSSLLALVLILLSACNRSEPFTLEFSANRSLGTLSIVEDVNCFTCGTGAQELGNATGLHNIRLPAPHWFVSLKMPKKAAHLLVHLQHPSLIKLGKIDLSRSDVTDLELTHLALIPLQYIDLSHTEITGQGLQYLKADPRWISVDLSGCNQLDPKYLSHFKDWKSATITLPYPRDDPKRDLARQLICDGQPEEICKTQIR